MQNWELAKDGKPLNRIAPLMQNHCWGKRYLLF